MPLKMAACVLKSAPFTPVFSSCWGELEFANKIKLGSTHKTFLLRRDYFDTHPGAVFCFQYYIGSHGTFGIVPICGWLIEYNPYTRGNRTTLRYFVGESRFAYKSVTPL